MFFKKKIFREIEELQGKIKELENSVSVLHGEKKGLTLKEYAERINNAYTVRIRRLYD